MVSRLRIVGIGTSNAHREHSQSSHSMDQACADLPTLYSERSFEIYKNHRFMPDGYRGPYPKQNDMLFHIAWNVGIRQGRIEGLSKDSRPVEDESIEGAAGKEEREQCYADN